MLHEAMSHSMLLTGAIVCGCVLDLIFADPVKLPHPVVIMGSCIRRMEHFLRSRFPAGEKGELAGGRILAALLPPCVFVLTGAVCMLSWHIHPALFFAVESIWCAQALAARGLANEARAVKASRRASISPSTTSTTRRTPPSPAALTPRRTRTGSRWRSARCITCPSWRCRWSSTCAQIRGAM